MSKNPVPAVPASGPASGPRSLPPVPCARAARHRHELILITPQQVLFGTAAAVPLPRRRLALLRHIASAPALVVSRRRRRGPVRYYPPVRLTFMEHAAMSREMDRL
ncbi:hypothetical protein [Mycolicibacterium goodii]|uniref:Uncharacterized protein n=1 Tax=Mycolicibacterium goodii TaxID=134601 RepID=A0A0K0XG18_MYCGD|nr:hypothetical protein AFA91_14085 [Mycolicibacterium goodii]